MTDPKNRDDEPEDITSSGEPDDADLDSTEDETADEVDEVDENSEEPTDEADDTDHDLDDEDVDQDAVDGDDDAEPDDEPERERKEKPVPTGKASRSGNPARAAAADDAESKPRSRQPVKPQKVGGNRWAAPAMLACAGIGLLWIVLYYVFANRDNPVPVMSDLGDWNLIVGMGFIVAAFGFSMKWE